MADYRDLLDILACPQCKGSLTIADDHTVELLRPIWAQRQEKKPEAGMPVPGKLEGGFCCPGCQLFYPIVDGIPDLVIEDALPLK